MRKLLLTAAAAAGLLGLAATGASAAPTTAGLHAAPVHTQATPVDYWYHHHHYHHRHWNHNHWRYW